MKVEVLGSEPVYVDETLDGYPEIRQHPELRSGEYLKVLVQEPQLLARIHDVSAKIAEDYRMNDGNWVVIPLYKGGEFFIKELAASWGSGLRSCIIPAQVRSRDGTSQAKELEIIKFPKVKSIYGKHILLVDGVTDTRFTLVEVFKKRIEGVASSCSVAIMADKTKAPDRLPLPHGLEIRYTAFQFGNPWLVGGSADHDQRFRKLPILAELVGAK